MKNEAPHIYVKQNMLIEGSTEKVNRKFLKTLIVWLLKHFCLNLSACSKIHFCLLKQTFLQFDLTSITNRDTFSEVHIIIINYSLKMLSSMIFDNLIFLMKCFCATRLKNMDVGGLSMLLWGHHNLSHSFCINMSIEHQ